MLFVLLLCCFVFCLLCLVVLCFCFVVGFFLWFFSLGAKLNFSVFRVCGLIAVSFFTPILPYALAFAAGAMIFVVVEEVIPETQQDKHTDIATLGFIGGFIVMMTLDVALG